MEGWKGKIRDFAIILGIITALFGGGFLVGSNYALNCRDLDSSEKSDTTIIVENIVNPSPIAVDSVKLGYDLPVIPQLVFLTDSIQVHDTLWLPRERKVYADSNYRAVVSGYMPRLDSMTIFRHDRVITNEVVRYVKSPARWGVGISAGYGAAIAGGRVVTAPYIGIGVTYNFWTFGRKK